MSSAVAHTKKAFKNIISDPIKNIKNNPLDPGEYLKKPMKLLDPGGAFEEPDTSANMSADQTIAALEEDVIPETEQSAIAESAALTAKKKKKETTQTILTSPLGSTQTAKTAVAKLGGY